MKPICPECKCQTIYHRIKSNTFKCRRCGNEWKKENISMNKQFEL